MYLFLLDSDSGFDRLLLGSFLPFDLRNDRLLHGFRNFLGLIALDCNRINNLALLYTEPVLGNLLRKNVDCRLLS
jgi:hypothetical protein